MSRSIGCFITLAVVAALTGCGGKPMPFPTPESEMGDRPGLLTGDKGVWQLYPAPQPQLR